MGLFDLFKKKQRKCYYYSESEQLEYENFIEKTFGSYKEVLHEIVSPDIHLDIIPVPPTDEEPFYKLITMGMGAFPMNVPEQLKELELEHAELVIYLPPDWNIQSQEQKDFWPIYFLKVLGRLPINYNTWLGFGHTIQANEDKSPFAENTKLNNILLLYATDYNSNPLKLRLSSNKKINFYQMFPIYQEELDFKSKHSAEELIERFDEDSRDLVLNINRKNFGI